MKQGTGPDFQKKSSESNLHTGYSHWTNVVLETGNKTKSLQMLKIVIRATIMVQLEFIYFSMCL